MSEWINVKDRLPEKCIYVLVCQKEIGCLNHSAPQVWIAAYLGPYEDSWDFGEWSLEEVAHWMPLPSIDSIEEKEGWPLPNPPETN
jgi:hypothetical protein